MATECTFRSQVDVMETLATADVPAASTTGARNVKQADYSDETTLNASSTVPATKSALFSQALSSGTATIDLTALDGITGTVDCTGLKVQVFKIKNPVGNAALTVSEGASNGYELMGNAFTAILLAGQHLTFYGNDATPDVGASAKNIDLSGTGSETCEITVVAG